MSSDYQMNFYLKVNKKIESKKEMSFWQKVLKAAVDDPVAIEGRENETLNVKGYDVVDISEETGSDDFESIKETEFCYCTQKTLKCFYQGFIDDVSKVIHPFAENRSVEFELTVYVWLEDREPDDIVTKSWEDMMK